MTAVALVLVVAVLIVALGLWTSRRRAVERERQRVDALRTLDGQFERVTESLDRARPPVPEPLPRAPAPLAAAAPGGRAALVDASTEAVRRARSEGTRLAVAVVDAADGNAGRLGGDVASAVGLTAYTVGPRSIAMLLPGAGRAQALGVVARIQAACGATGRAVELEPGEDAAELLTRVLGSGSAAD